MKRRVNVTIDVDTDDSGPSYFQDHNGTDLNDFKIVIRKDERPIGNEDATGVITLAYECGHMIGEIFRLSGMAFDPRGSRPAFQIGITSPERQTLVYKSEEEAWRLAETILQFDQERRSCLHSYQLGRRIQLKPILTYEVIR